jgi:hypothetical protein
MAELAAELIGELAPIAGADIDDDRVVSGFSSRSRMCAGPDAWSPIRNFAGRTAAGSRQANLPRSRGGHRLALSCPVAAELQGRAESKVMCYSS